MKAIFISANDKENLTRQLANLGIDKGVESLLFFMADEASFSEDFLIPLLQKNKKPIIGGVFPELIFNGDRKKQGTLLIPLSFKLKTQLLDLSKTHKDFFEELEIAYCDTEHPSSSLYVFTDALGECKDDFIESLFNLFGINLTYIGGGAGSLNFQPFKCIINNDGLHSNAAIIGWAPKRIALGVAHGWHSISEPLKVTKTQNNQIESINWKPAFEIYKKIVESHSGMKFTKDNFFDIAKSYPLGIAKMDAEMVVRDPFMVTNNMLHIVDTIHESEFISVLHGNMDSLLKGAENAIEIACSKTDDSMERTSVFCIDCISRVLFMQDDFKEELKIIGKKSIVNGILSIGEIASADASFLEIYNKTVVVGIW